MACCKKPTPASIRRSKQLSAAATKKAKAAATKAANAHVKAGTLPVKKTEPKKVQPKKVAAKKTEPCRNCGNK